jgi:hypothetical protein
MCIRGARQAVAVRISAPSCPVRVNGAGAAAVALAKNERAVGGAVRRIDWADVGLNLAGLLAAADSMDWKPTVCAFDAELFFRKFQ